MARSLSGRIKRKLNSHTYAKRSRDLADARSTQQRLSSAREYKRAKISRQNAETEAELAASTLRLQQRHDTESRNAINQRQSTCMKKHQDDEDSFFAEIDSPLTVVCAGCGERVAPSSVKRVRYDSSDYRFKLLTVETADGEERRGLVEAGVDFDGNEERVTFCQRCNRALSRRQVPMFTEASGFKLSPVPVCLARLNRMEARMLGIGICFTTCYTLGALGQTATRGNSINFWNDSYDIIFKLPRPAIRCGVVRLSKPGAEGPSTYYNVRPWYLREALDWLKANNRIYKEVLVDESLLRTMSSDGAVLSFDLQDEDCDWEDAQAQDDRTQDDAFAESFALGHEVDDETEEEKVMHALSGPALECAYILPRSERPMNEYSTKLLMQCCFPTLFPDGLGGFHGIDEHEDRHHEYKLAEYCAHLMAWHDRRFIAHPTFKFFCLNLIQRRQVDGLLQQIKIHPERPRDREDNAIPENGNDVSDAKTKAYLRELKPFFRAVRGTSLYWANVRDDLLNMIGNPALENKWPTFFITLSAADTVWPDFFCACDPSLTLEQAAALSPSRKRHLLNTNPDIAAHHFHRRFQAFFKHILCGKSRPLGDIIDFFWRIEFQRRGSPHVHALLWVAGAPDIIELSKTDEGREVLRLYADKFVSCLAGSPRVNSPQPNGSADPLCKRPPPKSNTTERLVDLHSVVERVQQHVCAPRSSCQRDGKCRFQFPKPLLDATRIKRDVSGGNIKISFDHRRNNESTNNYNPDMLSVWRANMDVKIIGNAYGAAEYTAAYVSKAEPDSVRFFKTIAKALRTLPNGVPNDRVLKKTATTLLAMREVSAQEAVYILSNTLCLFGKSRSVLKIKVSRHSQRYYRVPLGRPIDANLPTQDDDTIRVEDLENAYMHRPRSPPFEDLCYRSFCESYEVSTDGQKPGQRLQRWALLNGKGFIKAMTKRQAVRPSPRYRSNEQDADYCFAQLFLYKPWRKLTDIPTDDDAVIQAYAQWKQSGASNRATEINRQIEREEIIATAEGKRNDGIILPSPEWNIDLAQPLPTLAIATTTPQADVLFQSRFRYTRRQIEEANSFAKNVLRPFAKTFDNKAALGAAVEYVYPTKNESPAMTTDQWRPFALWMQQSRLRALQKTSNAPACTQLIMAVSGEGGTGKSWLIKHIIEDMRVVFGRAIAQKKIMLMAHQGSAAFLIGGKTLSSCLALPCHSRSSFKQRYVPLTATSSGQTSLRRLQNEYEHVQLVVIDEFSVVSCGMLHWIDQRFREIFPAHRDSPFGGRDLLFTGDPGQLGPVRSSPLTTPIRLLTSDAEQHGRRLWENIDKYFLLQEQNRGVNDPEWYMMLKRLRIGNTTPTDLDLINSRVKPPPSASSRTTYLAYTNADVDRANESALSKMPSPHCHLQARHDVTARSHSDAEQVDSTARDILLEEAKQIKCSTANYLPLELNLAIDAPVVLTVNLEQRIGLCNGSRGVVYDIIPDDLTATHSPIVLVRMERYTGPSFLENVTRIVPITCRTATLTTKSSTLRLSRTALPLRLGFATTIHKIQGQTCEKVVFNPAHLSNSALAYVALSRVRSRTDMYITAPLHTAQLQKPQQATTINEEEDTRVQAIVRATELSTRNIVSHMTLLAKTYNQQVRIRAAQR